MKKCRLIVISVVVTIFCLWSSLSLAYEQYFTYPGTRAMGMAGAFIGQANDSSAVWYNPAGLMQAGAPSFDLTVEYGKIPKRDETGKYNSETDLKFGSLGAANFPDPGWAVGLSYFIPYQVSLNLDTVCAGTGTCTSANSIGRVDASYKQMSFAMAKSFGPRFSIGGTVDAVNAESDRLSKIPTGIGYSLGALLTIADTEYLKINTGLLYRSAVEVGFDIEDITTNEEEVITFYLPDRPAIQGAGLNIEISPGFFILNANADYENILWSDAFVKNDSYVSFDVEGMNYTKLSYGGELLLPFSEAFSIALRGGRSEATPDDENKFVKIGSTTYGVGINMGHFAIDAASENREFSNNTGSANKYDFWSLSLSLQY